MRHQKPLTVLFDATPLVGAHRTGVGYYTQGLIEALARKYPENIRLTGYYFNFMGRKNIDITLQAPNVTLKAIRYFPGIIISPLSRVLGLQLPIEFFVFRKFDLQLFTNYVSFPTIRRTPQLITIHDLGYLDHPEYVQVKNLRYMRRLVSICAHRASRILVVSYFTKARVEALLKPAAPVVVTPIPYIPAAQKSNTLSQKLLALGIRPGKYLLTLGTVEPRKNITGLIAAYEQLPASIQAAYPLVIAGGKGWLDEPILAAINSAKNRGVNLVQTGYVSDGDREALYKNARAFTLASHYEGFGMPVLEAMYHGIPTAVSDLAIFREVGDGAVLFFDAANTTAMTRRLLTILTQTDKRTELAKLSRARAQTFSWDSVAAITYNTIREAVQS